MAVSQPKPLHSLYSPEWHEEQKALHTIASHAGGKGRTPYRPSKTTTGDVLEFLNKRALRQKFQKTAGEFGQEVEQAVAQARDAEGLAEGLIIDTIRKEMQGLDISRDALTAVMPACDYSQQSRKTTISESSAAFMTCCVSHSPSSFCSPPPLLQPSQLTISTSAASLS